MFSFSFRRKLLLLAVLLVIVIQLLTLFPVLDVIKRDSIAQAQRSVELASVVFGEFMANRKAQLLTTADVIAADFGFKQAVTGSDEPTMRSALQNHAERAAADVAVLLDLDGNVLASTAERLPGLSSRVLNAYLYDSERSSAHHAVAYLEGQPFQTVTVPVRAPVPVAWVMLGFAVDHELAAHIKDLTGLEATFLRFGLGDVDVLASTLAANALNAATQDLHLGNPPTAQDAADESPFFSALLPFLEQPSDLFIALQLARSEAEASYLGIRNILLLITGAALLLAVGASFWLANSVTRPVQLMAAAARRMQEGIYTEAINLDSSDELGELAAGFNSMQKAIADRERHIFHIAHHDSLSGLPNRELVVGRLRELMEDVEQLVVINLALDRFNRIVSILGHRAGDDVIKHVAGLLRSHIDEKYFLGHLSRNEFVLVLPGFSKETATEYVQNLTDLLRKGVVVSGATLSLQATAGLSCFPEHAVDAAELMRCASVAGNDAQLRVEPSVFYRIGQEDRALRQIRILGDFPAALSNDELELYFQPKIDCETCDVFAAEALIRWRHPEFGLLTPDTFVEAIEQAGSIAHLTRWVLKKATEHCAHWRSNGLDVAIAVNISVDDLIDEYLPYFLLDLTQRNGLSPSAITLEVTESAIMHHVQTSLAVVSCVRELGFRVAIDDFGTGHAALSQLKRLPLDELKIDKSLVMNLQSPKDEAIVRTAIELGHQLGLSVVAEGVEDAQTLERVRAQSCDSAQGFYISKPLPAEDFPAWVRRWAKQQGKDILSLVKAERAVGGRSAH